METQFFFFFLVLYAKLQFFHWQAKQSTNFPFIACPISIDFLSKVIHGYSAGSKHRATDVPVQFPAALPLAKLPAAAADGEGREGGPDATNVGMIGSDNRPDSAAAGSQRSGNRPTDADKKTEGLQFERSSIRLYRKNVDIQERQG